MNGYYGIGARQQRSDIFFAIAVCRGRGAPDFEESDTAALQLLLPNLTTALRLTHQLNATREHAEGLLGLLDRLDVGIILADAAARPLFVNARAAAISCDGDGLGVNEAGLMATTPEATRALRQRIAAAADPAGVGRHWRLPRRAHRTPLILTMLPIWRAGMTIPGTRAPRVAIFIKEVEPHADIDPAVLAETFHLTRRESEIAALLADGLTLNAIAARLDLGLGTVRNHLKRAFDKTGMRSQATLVALVRSFSNPWH